MAITDHKEDAMDITATADRYGVADVIARHVADGTKFDARDLTESPFAGELHALAVDYTRSYTGTFEFMVDLSTRANRKPADATPLDVMSVGQAKGALNCALAELRRMVRTAPSATADPVTEPGIYTAGDDVFKVQVSKTSGALYAKKLVPLRDAQGDRMVADGDHVRWEWEYAPGIIRTLTPADRMDEAAARAFGLRYGICAACGRGLKVAESVERGIGPVCAKWFRF